MTSKWTMSAPAAMTASTSAPRRAKSADRIEGAIQGVGMRLSGGRGGFGPGQARQRLAVLGAGARDDFRGQVGAGRLLVPVERLQVVAHELLVEARRARADAVGVGGPEARGVRRHDLVDQGER